MAGILPAFLFRFFKEKLLWPASYFIKIIHFTFMNGKYLKELIFKLVPGLGKTNF